MIRSLSTAVLGTGLAAAVILACSDGLAPTPGQSVIAARQDKLPALTVQQSGTTNRLQAVSPVDRRIVWASGINGTYTVTTNGGATWRAGVVPGAEALQFRDVEAVSDKVAYLLAAGEGTASRIYKTRDGGKSWTLQFENQDPKAFYDCFAFWNPDRGITFSDAVNGRFPVIRTNDGKNWKDIGDRLPPAQPGEAAFAASGTCVATLGHDLGWIATGGAAKARILATTDGGNQWQAYDTPIAASSQDHSGAGGTSVAFRDSKHGILTGGDLAKPTDLPTDNVAVSNDGGKTWNLAKPTPFPGPAYGLSYVHGFRRHAVVATGPGGAAWSRDEGDKWTILPGVANFWAVAFADRGTGWLVGTDGRILRIDFSGVDGGNDDNDDQGNQN